MNLDFYLFGQINRFAGKYFWLDTLTIFFAQYFEYVFIFLLILFLARNFREYIYMIVEAFFAAILAKEIFVDIIRQLWPKVRPFVEKQIYLLIQHPVTASFPSAHAAFYFAIATTIYFYHKKAGLVFLISALLISIARVFSGVHWLSDILVGSLIGVFSAFIVRKVAKEIYKE